MESSISVSCPEPRPGRCSEQHVNPTGDTLCIQYPDIAAVYDALCIAIALKYSISSIHDWTIRNRGDFGVEIFHFISTKSSGFQTMDSESLLDQALPEDPPGGFLRSRVESFGKENIVHSYFHGNMKTWQHENMATKHRGANVAKDSLAKRGDSSQTTSRSFQIIFSLRSSLRNVRIAWATVSGLTSNAPRGTGPEV